MIISDTADTNYLRDLITKCKSIIQKYGLEEEEQIVNKINKRMEILIRYEHMQVNRSNFTRPASPNFKPQVSTVKRGKTVPRNFTIRSVTNKSKKSGKGENNQSIINEGHREIKVSQKRPQTAKTGYETDSFPVDSDIKHLVNEQDGYQRKNSSNQKSNKNPMKIGRFFDSQISESQNKKEKGIKISKRNRSVSNKKGEALPIIKDIQNKAIREYVQGLHSFMKLGKSLNDQVKNLEFQCASNNMYKPLRKTNHIFDETDSLDSSRKFDQNMKENFEKLLESHKVYEERTVSIQKRLESIENKIKHQSTIQPYHQEEGISILPLFRPMQTMKNPQYQIEEVPKVAVSGDNTLLSPPTNSRKHEQNQNNRIKVKTKHEINTPTVSDISNNTQRSVMASIGIVGFEAALKSSLDIFSRGEKQFKEVRQVIANLEGKLFQVGYSSIHVNNDYSVVIKLYHFSVEAEEESQDVLAQNELNREQIEYIFDQFHVIEALSCYVPSSNFIHISYFLNLVLSRFIRVN